MVLSNMLRGYHFGELLPMIWRSIFVESSYFRNGSSLNSRLRIGNCLRRCQLCIKKWSKRSNYRFNSPFSTTPRHCSHRKLNWCQSGIRRWLEWNFQLINHKISIWWTTAGQTEVDLISIERFRRASFNGIRSSNYETAVSVWSEKLEALLCTTGRSSVR